jgi:GNAT superfamily N-acetyltransferase
MPDMLVNLFQLPEWQQREENLKKEGIKIKRAIPPEKARVSAWIEEHFEKAWSSEAEVAFAKSPLTIFIAYQQDQILGFACYDTTAKGFFGPTGVSEKARGRGIGTVLLLKSLLALKESGYAYAVIGDAGPVEYYKKIAKAQVIENSGRGIYQDMLT